MWRVIGETTLQLEDKTLIESGEWLTDQIIFAAQQLLKMRHPLVSGLQNTVLQYTKTLEVQSRKEFIQILHAGGSHWITVSTVGCPLASINVFDSMNLQLTSSLKEIIADMLHTDSKFITINYVTMQQRAGGSDCGFFAIAAACTVCYGQDPGKLIFYPRINKQTLVTGI